jgi:erythromycin esterase
MLESRALVLALCVFASGAAAQDRLLTDSELVTPMDTAVTTERPAWAEWVHAHAHPIRSLTSTDYSDLEFLRPLLTGKRIVQLGESGHSVAEFGRMKVRLVKFLHERLGYDVIAFESGLYDCGHANAQAASLSGETLMRHCVFPVWYTTDVWGLGEYIKSTRATAHPLMLAGFDMQVSSRDGWSGRDSLLRDAILDIDAGLAHRIFVADSTIRALALAGDSVSRKHLIAYTDTVLPLYDSANVMLSQRHLHPFARRVAASAAAALRQRQMETIPDSNSFLVRFTTNNRLRDAAMATNLDFILREQYPRAKVITWAHNTHVRHDGAAVGPAGIRDNVNMGSWVAAAHRAELYTIGFYMYRGRTAFSNGQEFDVRRGEPGSLESILFRGRKKFELIDFSRAVESPGTSWMFQPIKTKIWGGNDEEMTVRDQYDAVLFIDRVTPAVTSN